jgi:hypothetical protein
VLSGNIVQLLGFKHAKIVANQTPSILRVDNIVNKTAFGGYHGICKPFSVFLGVFNIILLVKIEIPNVVSKYNLVLVHVSSLRRSSLLVATRTYLSSIQDLYSTFGAHDSNFCSWPGVVAITSQMLTGHNIVSSSIGLARDDRNLGHIGFTVGKQELGTMANNSA